MLLSIFAGIGLAEIVERPVAWRGLRLASFDRARWLKTAMALAGLLFVTLTIPVRGILDESRRYTENYVELERMGQQHEATLKQISSERPDRWNRWYAERQSAALVRSGQILDHEACTLQQADLVGIVDRKAFTADFVAGKYPFVQRTYMAEIPMLSAVFDACYRLRLQSYMPDRGEARLVDILEYAGPYGSCRFEDN
jgi:hypothetical protein